MKAYTYALLFLVNILCCFAVGCKSNARPPSPEAECIDTIHKHGEGYAEELIRTLTSGDVKQYNQRLVAQNTKVRVFEGPYRFQAPFFVVNIANANEETKDGWFAWTALSRTNGYVHILSYEFFLSQHGVTCAGELQLSLKATSGEYTLSQPFIFCEDGLRHYGGFTITKQRNVSEDSSHK